MLQQVSKSLLLLRAVASAQRIPKKLSKTKIITSLLGRTINALQAFAFLETVHCYFGFTGGKVFTNFIQAFGRALILVYLSLNSRAQNSEFVFLLFASWCFADIIRYPYYLFTVGIFI